MNPTDQELNILQEYKKRLEATAFPDNFDHSDQELTRFLRATKLDLDKSETLMTDAIKWYNANRPDLITEDKIKRELMFEKAFWHGKDKKNRPLLVIKGARHIVETRDLNETMMFGIYKIEQGKILMKDNGVDKYCIIYDRTNYTRKNFDFDLMKKMVELARFYPERVSTIYIINPDWLFNVLFAIVKPFMDPVTLSKTRTVSDVKELLKDIDEEQLHTDYGGKLVYTSPYSVSDVGSSDNEDISLESTFQKISIAVGISPPPELSPEQLNELSGLYNQASKGDNTTPQPWAMQFETRSKWEAWMKYKGLSKEQAMEKYFLFFLENSKKPTTK